MYFSEAQIQRMIEKFPMEVKGKLDVIVIKEATPREHDFIMPKKIVVNAIKEDKFTFYEIKNNIVKFKASFESLDNYNQPSEKQFKTVLDEIEEELSKTFGYKVEVTIKANSFGKEPDVIPTLYFGELDKKAEYSMLIRIFLNTPVSSL